MNFDINNYTFLLVKIELLISKINILRMIKCQNGLLYVLWVLLHSGNAVYKHNVICCSCSSPFPCLLCMRCETGQRCNHIGQCLAGSGLLLIMSFHMQPFSDTHYASLGSWVKTSSEILCRCAFPADLHAICVAARTKSLDCTQCTEHIFPGLDSDSVACATGAARTLLIRIIKFYYKPFSRCNKYIVAIFHTEKIKHRLVTSFEYESIEPDMKNRLLAIQVLYCRLEYEYLWPCSCLNKWLFSVWRYKTCLYTSKQSLKLKQCFTHLWSDSQMTQRIQENAQWQC